MNPSSGDPAGDKFELHYRQQLSALVDGELAPDEARFLLRRLEHDGELAGRRERWQLCGDVLRGQVRRAADPALAGRVAAAIAAAPALEASQPRVANAGRSPSWIRWGGGGAALAASVAVVAMLVGRQDIADPVPVPAVVQQQVLPATEAVLAAASPVAAPAPVVTSPAPRSAPRQVAVAATPRAVRAPVRRAEARELPDVAQIHAASLADAASAVPAAAVDTDPFASSHPLQARPWPRAVLPGTSAGGYAASLGSLQGTGGHAAQAQEPVGAFYPFDPRLPAQVSAPDGTGLPVPPDGD
nr:sigma-E factor negative regulatory protein [Pseudoxanthomonas koreensis]